MARSHGRAGEETGNIPYIKDICMQWFTNLLWGDSMAQAVVALCLAVALGLVLGNIRVRGVGLGVGGVLFSSLVIGHLGMAPKNHAVIEFVREFGLILFVFTVGLQVGPGFVDSLRRRGVRLNLMAALVVVLGVLTTLACTVFFDLPPDVAVGLFSGAVTNTPSLAAASQMFMEMLAPDRAEQAINAAGLGYAVAYPFGIMGIIITMLLVRLLCHVNVREETQSMEAQLRAHYGTRQSVTLVVQNPTLYGLSLRELLELLPESCVISRMEKDKRALSARPEYVLTPGVRLHVVCSAESLPRVQALIGSAAEQDLRQGDGIVEARAVLVTQSAPVGKNVQQLGIVPQNGLTVTRIVRAGMEFAATPHVHLHFGDKLMLVGEVEALDHAEALLGNSPRQLDHPHVLPLFVGIVLGVVLGSIPVAVPGLPAPLKLGLAGGPLLAAIALSRVSTLGGLHWYMPHSANLMLREVGIALFLACVGLNAGDRFFAALADGSGFYWMSVAAIITLVPLLVAAFVGRLFLGCNYASMCGLLSGSMTDPPALAFAVQSLQSDAPASVYATVYPLTMVLRILAGQMLVVMLCGG